eukprot:GFUD01033220.1.p1 GENE.GFUD01033220.1~~GFUD01033220.1.p1  ORF type:complete len:644 (+),score=221.26 GFUD01033220.1:60-1991(+)
MEPATLVEKIQDKLLLNDEMLKDIDDKRAELKRICEEEQNKISAVCEQVKARIVAAGETLKSKSQEIYCELDQVLGDKREVVRTGSLVLCPELEEITDLIEQGEEANFDVQDCWDRIKEVLNHQQIDSDPKIPLFYPSPTLSKVKACDLGFLCLAEYLPSQFELLLTSPMSCLQLNSNNNSCKVVCNVKTDCKFTDSVQSCFKFSIKNRNCKETVEYSKEYCKLSEDKKSFQIAFLAQKPGMYLVTVLLYDQHITNSPLTVPVISKQLLQDQNKYNEGEKLPKNTNLLKKEPKYAMIAPPGSDYNHNPRPAELRCPLPSSTVPRSSIPPHIATDQSSHSSSPPSISPSKESPSDPLDLQLHSSEGKLVCLRMLSLQAGAKPDSVFKPIGLCILHNRNIVVSSTFNDKVKIFSPSGQFLSLVTIPQSNFTRPTDMVTLHSGQFAVRDDNKVMVFTSEGGYMKTLWQDRGQVKCFGLAQNKEDMLITIMETMRPRRTDLLFFDLKTGELSRKIEMNDIISDKTRSKCRFLTYQLDKLYITDLGLDCVYILDPVTVSVKVFGCSGSGPGQLSDPAGLVVDSVGNMVVADSRNHRLCLFNQEGKFVCNLSLSPETRRPSGVVLDKAKRELYVLNLQGREAMTKYKIK